MHFKFQIEWYPLRNRWLYMYKHSFHLETCCTRNGTIFRL